jgi:hypothetical protein
MRPPLVPADDKHGCTVSGGRLLTPIPGVGIFPVGYTQPGRNRSIGLAGNTAQGGQHHTQRIIKAKE